MLLRLIGYIPIVSYVLMYMNSILGFNGQKASRIILM